MKFLRLAVNAVFKLVEPVAIALFGLLFVLVLAQIVLRYVFNSPLVWSEELARYLFIWICFFGWLMASKHGGHIAIATVVDRLPDSGRKLVNVAIELAAIVFACFLVKQGYALVLRNLTVTTSSLFFPFAVVYAIVPIAGAAAILISLRNISVLLGGNDDPQDAGGEVSK